MMDITTLPKVPSFYKGLINLRGQIVSVIDLKEKLGMGRVDVIPKATCIVLSRAGDIVIGTIVDEVVEVAGFTEEQIDYADKASAEASYDGVYAVARDSGDSLTLLMDLGAALNKAEFKIIKDQSTA